MKTLLILRHAKSSWEEEDLDDHERPLNKRGLKDAPHIGEVIKKQGFVPDLMLSSSAKRAHHTAELVAASCGYAGEISKERDLYSFVAQDYLDALAHVNDEYQRVMVIGHNPGLEELLQQLTGVQSRLPTAALAVVQLPVVSWRDLETGVKGELITVLRPKEI